MQRDTDRDKLDSLARRIDAAQKAARPPVDRDANDPSARCQALEVVKVGSDFVAAIVLFGAAGWYFDGLFGSSPWLMLGFLLVGFGAGLWMVLRFLFAQGSADGP